MSFNPVGATGIKRPALRYFGGKWKITPWIIRHIPEHDCYVEPFGGAMSVLLQKAPSALEVYNDLDGEVVNFFRVLRTRTSELMRAVDLTPFSRAEYKAAHEIACDDLERARRLYVRAWQGIGGPSTKDQTGWRSQVINNRGKTTIEDWIENRHLALVAERIRSVQIECDDAIRVIERFDAKGTVFYCDPPYVAETRTARWSGHAYENEMDNADHGRLLECLQAARGMVLLSAYDSQMYRKALKGWHVAMVRARVNNMNGSAKRTECLWISPRAFESPRQHYFRFEEAE